MRILFLAILGKSVKSCEGVCMEFSYLKELTVTISGFVGQSS